MDLLGTYATIMFGCVHAIHGDEETQREKLEKLRSIWLTQRYFSNNVLEVWNTILIYYCIYVECMFQLLFKIMQRLNNIEKSHQDYRQTQNKNYASAVAEIVNNTQTQYKNYEMQHQQYAQHVRQQIATLEGAKSPIFSHCNQKRNFCDSACQNMPPIMPLMQNSPSSHPGNLGPPHQGGPVAPQRRSRFDAGPAPQQNPVPNAGAPLLCLYLYWI